MSRVKRIFLPAGQILGLSLIGMLVLSALVYYKAVKAQRYLEPSLAIARPRIEFASTVKKMIQEEFGNEDKDSILFSADSMYIRDSLVFKDSLTGSRTPDYLFVQKLGRVFKKMLHDDQMRNRFDMFLIGTRVPVSPHSAMNRRQRTEMQDRAESILSALYRVEPELERKYGIYFAATVIPVAASKSDRWIEVRIIPSEHLHIEMIRNLGKYYF